MITNCKRKKISGRSQRSRNRQQMPGKVIFVRGKKWKVYQLKAPTSKHNMLCEGQHFLKRRWSCVSKPRLTGLPTQWRTWKAYPCSTLPDQLLENLRLFEALSSSFKLNEKCKSYQSNLPEIQQPVFTSPLLLHYFQLFHYSRSS